MSVVETKGRLYIKKVINLKIGVSKTEHKTSRILAETLIRKTLKDINLYPERSLRNIVDLASEVLSGRFQNEFFKATQTMLKNEHSSYYALVKDISANVEHERLIRFGMNVGYNSCTFGAKKIRDIEKTENFNIPWSVSFKTNPEMLAKNIQKYNSIIKQGEKIGIYTWLIFEDSCSENLLLLAEKNPESAFAFFVSPSNITSSFTEKAGKLNNTAIILEMNDDTEAAAEFLRKQKMLYSVYLPYSKDDIDFITSGGFFSRCSNLHSPFSVLAAKESCSEDIKKLVHDFSEKIRNSQTFPTVPWEFEHDGRFVDSIISGDSCSAFFDEHGNLVADYESYSNIFEENLKGIFKKAFPKSTPKGETAQ